MNTFSFRAVTSYISDASPVHRCTPMLQIGSIKLWMVNGPNAYHRRSHPIIHHHSIQCSTLYTLTAEPWEEWAVLMTGEIMHSKSNHLLLLITWKWIAFQEWLYKAKLPPWCRSHHTEWQCAQPLDWKACICQTLGPLKEESHLKGETQLRTACDRLPFVKGKGERI